jgi:ADP-ribose pyrophosphatase YjhB (NUDIX family)
VKEDPRSEIRHCPECGGAEFQRRIPERDDRTRLCCSRCGYIHYVGPALAAGAIVRDDRGRVCLLRRTWDPGRGRWTFPGGFVDLDEEPRAAALRETEEETGLFAEVEGLLGLYGSLGPKDRRVVIAVYRARLTGISARNCDEAMETRWFARDEIPWHDLAFESSGQALRDFFG